MFIDMFFAYKTFITKEWLLKFIQNAFLQYEIKGYFMIYFQFKYYQDIL